MKRLTIPLLTPLLAFGLVSANAAITDGLVSYWPLDASDGVNTPDHSFGNAMSIQGVPTVSAGQFSNAFTFNGTSTYLTNLHSTDNGVSGLPIHGRHANTVTLWVKGAAQTARYLFSHGNTANNNPIFIIQTGNAAGNNNKLDVILRTDGNVAVVSHVVSTNVVFDNNWHHIAWVDDRGSVKVYIDGNLDQANFSYDRTYADFTYNTTAIGTLARALVATGNIFNGQIDEVAVWERALSQAEVNEVRTNGIAAPGALIPARPAALLTVPADATKQNGDWHLFSVDPMGNRPLSYQWSKNGVPIVDATNRTFRVTGLTTNNTGDFYSVTVTNPVTVTPAASSNATLTVAADPAPALTNALEQYWPLDSFALDGTNVISHELHYGHSLLMRNMDTNTDIVMGQYSNAVFFLASLPTHGIRSNGTPVYLRTNYSVSLWVKGNGVGQNDRRVFSDGRDAGNNNPLFSLGTDNTGVNPTATVFIRGDNGVNTAIVGRKSTRTAFDDNWHHMVWTDANGQGKLYVDGVLDETDYTYTRPAINTLNLTYIGAVARSAVPPPNAFTGNIDDVATWNRVLTWTEIQQIMTNGIPVPEGIVAPSFASQPPERTNNVFVSDDVTFPVIVNGTLPFSFQWRKNGAPISGASNPTALTDTLVLTNVQVADSNTTYSVVVTNASGAITSSVVKLYVQDWAPVTSGEVLKMDVDLTGLPDVQPGFSPMVLSQNPTNFANAVRVTLSGIGTTLAERHRSVPPDVRAVVNAPPELTQAQLYNDFVFANSTTDGTGLSVLVERLAPSTKFGVTIWSFDAVSSTIRAANWAEMSSGNPIPITNSWTIGGVPVTIINDLTYIFDGAIMPTNDFAQTLGALLVSSPTGRLQFDAVRTGGNSFGAFFNAIRLVANPVATRIRNAVAVGGNLRITIEGEYPGQPISLVGASAVTGPYGPIGGATTIETRGPIVVIDVPIGTDTMFYRASSFLP